VLPSYIKKQIKMAYVNLDGSQKNGFERHIVADDVYTGVIDEISPPKLTEFEGVGKNKTILNISIDNKEKTKKIPLLYWLTLAVTKGGQNFSPSNAYKLLEKSGDIENFRAYYAEKKSPEDDSLNDEALVDFLKMVWLGRSVRIVTVCKKSGSGVEYSAVKDLLNFLPIDGTEAADSEPAEEATVEN
jgi:hypothetical protein